MEKREIEKSTLEVIHSEEISKATGNLLQLVIDMETGVRGFFLTGQDNFLDPYHNSFKEFPESFSKLRLLLKDNPDQIQTVDSVQILISKWNDQFGTELIAAARDRDVSIAGEQRVEFVMDNLIRKGKGKSIIDEIRRKFKRIDNKVEISQAARFKNLNNSLASVNVTLFTLTLIGSAFIITLTFLVILSINRRITRMVGLSKQIASGTFGQMQDDSKDEMKELSTSLNTMSEQLQKAFEGQKEAEEKALRNEKRFRMLVENANDIIYRSDEKGNFIYVNPIAVKITGYTKRELLRMNFGDLIVPEDKVEVAEFYQQQFKHKQPTSYKEFKISTKSGKVIWIGQNVQAWLSSNKIIGFLSIARDISEIKVIQDQLTQAKKIAEESVKEKEYFLANMSHEIRTPMNAIIGFTDLVSDTKLNGDQKEYIKAIKTSGENLLNLVNDILDFSKINANKISFEKTDFDVVDVLKNCIKMFEPKAKDKNLQIKLEYSDDLLTKVIGDPHRLSQVVINLLGNAIKFTERGHVKLKVSSGTILNKECIYTFEIEDTGIGIQNDKLDNIFETFTQANTETTRKFGGTGLGLSIVKSIVELQGGKIWVTSSYGYGSVFSFSIKFKINNPSIDCVDQKPDKILGGIRENTKVLLVEDNHLNQLLGKKVLTNCGANVEVASNGRIALEMLLEKPYDLVLMDIRMPEMDGYTTAGHIRNDFQAPIKDIPIIAMTANAVTGEIEKCRAVGMNDYISKPFKADDLVNKISKWTEVKLNEPILTDTTAILHNPEFRYTNTEYLKELCDNNTEFMIEMILTFFRQKEEFLKIMGDALKDKNWQTLGEIAHKMKSSISVVGIAALEEPIDKLERFSFDQIRLDEIAILLEVVDDICTESVKELTMELEILKNVS